MALTTDRLTRQFAEQVRFELGRQELTQRDLSLRMVVSEARVSQMLSGNISPKLETVARVADALQCEVELWIGAHE